MTYEQLTKLAHRFRAALDLEKARQIARENTRYGYTTGTDMRTVRTAEEAYDLATTACFGRPA